MGITVLDGDFSNSDHINPTFGGINYVVPATEWNKFRSVHYAKVDNIQFLNENISGGGGFSPLMGAVGMETIGPAGLLLGVNEKKAKQTVYFKCTLEDGRSFTGSTSAKEYQKMRQLMTQKPPTKSQKWMNDVIGPIIVLTIILGFLMYLGWH